MTTNMEPERMYIRSAPAGAIQNASLLTYRGALYVVCWAFDTHLKLLDKVIGPVFKLEANAQHLKFSVRAADETAVYNMRVNKSDVRDSADLDAFMQGCLLASVVKFAQ